MSKQISWAEVVDFVERRLSAEQLAVMEQRIAADSDAQDSVAWLEQFNQWRDKTQFVEPPAEVDEIALSVFRRKYPRKVEDTRPHGVLGVLRAVLQYDSWQGIALGARSAQSGSMTDTRQLIYSTEYVDVALNLRPRQGNTTIKGQLLPNDEKMEPQFDVALTRDGTELVQTRTDKLGNFRFDGVENGAYELILRDDESVVTVPDIVI